MKVLFKGFIAGDEASGKYFGKKISFIFQYISEDLIEIFEKKL